MEKYANEVEVKIGSQQYQYLTVLEKCYVIKYNLYGYKSTLNCTIISNHMN